jgi:hypothetical protein
MQSKENKSYSMIFKGLPMKGLDIRRSSPLKDVLRRSSPLPPSKGGNFELPSTLNTNENHKNDGELVSVLYPLILERHYLLCSL